ncbi:MAG: phage tail protein [Heliomarina sp.]|uniref:phage tail protein n=1 Tax=Heliomarina sp. TaxID=2917556 RepID=UPI0040590D0C
MPAAAAFLGGVIGAAAPAIGAATFGAWAAGTGFASFLTTTFVGKLLSTVAVSALSMALADTSTPADPGIRTQQTLTGGTTPASFVMGKYATEGQMVCPPMSHGYPGGTPNPYLTFVIDLGDVPGQTLESYFINGEEVELGEEEHAEYGAPVVGKFEGYAWIKFYDGTQTVADPGLLAKYSDYPDRPWTENMVGTGICYAICTFRLNNSLYSGSFPAMRFIVGGIPLYDPRKDSTVGGSGAHRWSDRSTWEVSENPFVQSYNIMRGIELPSGDIWGGEMEADDLPLSNWFASMNAADVSTEATEDNFEPAYRTSYEVYVSDEPASVIEQLGKASAGRFAEIGGVWKSRCGGPGLPSHFMTDEDINIRESQNFEPFPGIGDAYNGVHASFPDPANAWNPHDAPPRYYPDFEAEDGDRRLVADLSLPAAPYGDQVQRLMVSYIEEERRFRRHSLSLAPDAIPLEPLDSISWTSARNGYASKVFEVIGFVDPLLNSKFQVSLREVDSSDYSWTPAKSLPRGLPTLSVTEPAEYEPGAWSFTKGTVKDGAGSDRRPALVFDWAGFAEDDVAGIAYRVRTKVGSEQVCRGTDISGTSGQVKVSEGILPGTAYEGSIKLIPISDRKSKWSDWEEATTDDVRLSSGDLPLDVNDWSVATDDPIAVSLSTSLIDDGRAEITAIWVAVTDAAYYELGITRTGGGENILPVDGTSYSFETAPGVEWSVRLRTRNALNKPSGWTASETLTAASDSTAPPVPGQPNLTPSFRSIWTEWTFAGASDFSHFELCYKATAGTPAVSTTVPVIETPSKRFEIGGLDAATTRYVFVRAVDTSGNKSDWSVGSSATTLAGSSAVTTEDLEGLIDQTSFASGLAAIEIVSSVPSDADPANFPGRSVVDTSDGIGKFYRFIGGTWTSAFDGGDLTINSIQTASIAAGAVKAAQLDAGAVTARTLGVGDFTNMILNSRLENDEGWAFNGSVGVGTDSVATTPGVFVYPVDVTNRYAWTEIRIPVEPGDQFFARAKARGAGSFEARIVFRFYDKDGSILEQPSSLLAATSSYLSFNLSHTAPAGATEMRCDFGRSGGGSGAGYISAPFLMRKNTGEMLVDGVLKANHFVTDEAVITVTAQIANAIITNAKISDVNATKITVGALDAGITVGPSGVTIGTVESRAANPAARVNAGTTLIQPGKIQISGSTTIEDWRRAGDQTKIDGGQISTATVTAEKLQIGLRGLAVSELNFSTSGNVLSWTAGKIKYIDNNSTESTRNLSAGSFNYSGSNGVVYIYWTRGATTLSASFDLPLANTGENVVLAAYRGGQDVNPNFGRTIIEGDYIATGAITADKADFTSLSALGLTVDTADIDNLAVKNAQIDNLTITAGKVESNGITKVRKSTGTNPSITFTPSIDGEMTAMVWLDIETEGAGAATGTVTLRIDGDSYGYLSVRREDLAPSTSYAQETGMIVWKINTSAGVSMTIDLQNSGATINAASIVAIETKR